jgi:hypothetical protein
MTAISFFPLRISSVTGWDASDSSEFCGAVVGVPLFESGLPVVFGIKDGVEFCVKDIGFTGATSLKGL